MSRLSKKFKELSGRGEKALVPYITCGDGGAEITVEAGIRMAEAGADVLELGVPFNDPVADGPVIQDAMERALKAGMTPPGVLDAAGRIRDRSDIPIVIMTYYNPIYAYGPERFCRDAADKGVDGILVVDLPADTADEFRPLAVARGLDMIFLLTPVSGPERIAITLERAGGFVYFVSVTGVTGARDQLPAELPGQVKEVKSKTDLPVCVGFGVKGQESAKKVAGFCDGVVVGSAIVKAMNESERPAQTAAEIARNLKDAIR